VSVQFPANEEAVAAEGDIGDCAISSVVVSSIMQSKPFNTAANIFIRFFIAILLGCCLLFVDLRFIGMTLLTMYAHPGGSYWFTADRVQKLWWLPCVGMLLEAISN